MLSLYLTNFFLTIIHSGLVVCKKIKIHSILGRDYQAFQNIMNEFGIERIDNLAFLDEEV